jgi:hypothetical protein
MDGLTAGRCDTLSQTPEALATAVGLLPNTRGSGSFLNGTVESDPISTPSVAEYATGFVRGTSHSPTGFLILEEGDMACVLGGLSAANRHDHFSHWKRLRRFDHEVLTPQEIADILQLSLFRG